MKLENLAIPLAIIKEKDNHMILLLFFTRGVSLETWVNQGLLNREKLIYEEHIRKKNFKKIFWVTYGTNDLELSNKLKEQNKLNSDINILDMPKYFNIPKVGSYLFSLAIPFLYFSVFKTVDIFKTNQMDGAWVGVISRFIYNKPLIVRTGYTVSQLLCSKRNNKLRCIWFKFIEKFVYNNCDKAIVTSNHNVEYLKKNYQIHKTNITVLPNYIDLSVFKPQSSVTKYSERVLYVGRLNSEKNLFNLIEAIAKVNYVLDIYGEGSQIKSQLIVLAKKHDVKINFFGVVANSELAHIYTKYEYYVLPSFHEGMPKTLVEAMASGCLCIGTNVAGINEIISNGVNGILAVDTSSKGIYDALKKAIDSDDKSKIIDMGISMVREKYSLDLIVERERLIFKEVEDAE